MIILDTSAMLAAIDPKQSQRARTVEVLRQAQRRILSPFVLAELDYLLNKSSGPSEALRVLNDVAKRAYELADFSSADIELAIRVLERYSALNLGITDASIMVLAERHDCSDIFTLDQRHFRAVTRLDGRPFRLLPADA